MFRQRHQMILSREIGDQISLQSDWKRDTPGHTYPKVVVSHAPSLNDYLHAKKTKY